jgi:pimeloyl-ACP methyl ester carboxylesterase
MKTILRALAVGIAVAILGLSAFAMALRSGLLSPTEAQLRAKYGLPTSQFVEIDGEPIHYSDEGEGEAIVLVHGTFGSLRMWKDWVATLGDRYRIVRFDRPPYGLSGPDPQDRYGPQREVEIIAALTARLGLQEFFLVATSSGGQSVTQFAAEHPQRIKGLVLSNIAVKPMPADPYRNTWMVRQSRKLSPYLGGWHPEMEWRAVLERNIIDHSKVTDALVTEYAELNNRPASFLAARARGPSPPPRERTPGDLAKITAPTLVLWSQDDSERPPRPVAEDAMALLGARDKSLVIIPRCEHMMPLDCGPASAAAAAAFIDRVSAAKDAAMPARRERDAEHARVAGAVR